jgi:hypothetical protein
LTEDFVNKAMRGAQIWLTHFQTKGNSAKALQAKWIPVRVKKRVKTNNPELLVPMQSESKL